MQEIYTDWLEVMSKEGMELSENIGVIQVKSKTSNSKLKNVKSGSILKTWFNFNAGKQDTLMWAY